VKPIFAAITLAISVAACHPAEPLAVSDAVFQPPLGSSGIGAAYFTVRSAAADRIVSVTSPQADSIEIHASVTKNGRASMQRLETVELPAGKVVEFVTGGMHLMVFSPRQGPGEGSFPITIELQSGAKKTIAFENRRGGEDNHS
jgi:periplasmic copper chaperone A